MNTPTKRLKSASFFWKNDQPGGLGFTLGPPSFSPEQLEAMFTGDVVKQYIADSDAALGSHVVKDYLDQLNVIARKPFKTSADIITAALNITWLCERGFIPNDEFNGPQFIAV